MLRRLVGPCAGAWERGKMRGNGKAVLLGRGTFLGWKKEGNGMGNGMGNGRLYI